jgi:hypothetical protein
MPPTIRPGMTANRLLASVDQPKALVIMPEAP